jgi:class 3 adenylate cyclase
MSEMRKLAAILVADVVGYSRLAGADEERTLARLRGLRSDFIDPAIAAHRGRIVKRTGDGAIVEFRSVVDAVRCAIEVQNGLVERNAGLPPERRIEFRVGIHLGDVVEESDGDLRGDGVNIAARLQTVAKPGAICLSEQAYWQVKGRLDLAVTDLGATQLKNIAEPVRVYSLDVGQPSEGDERWLLSRANLEQIIVGNAAETRRHIVARGPEKILATSARPPSIISMPCTRESEFTVQVGSGPENVAEKGAQSADSIGNRVNPGTARPCPRQRREARDIAAEVRYFSHGPLGNPAARSRNEPT